MSKSKKRKRGRPARPMPERIDATPEQIADVVMRMHNKTEWRYMQDRRAVEGKAG